MRTTIEIPDSQRARLLEIAARRGEKGFSGLIQEAIAKYLEHEARVRSGFRRLWAYEVLCAAPPAKSWRS